MEKKLRQIVLGVSRVRDIRRILQAWEKALTFGEALGCSPEQIWKALHVRVNLPGWVPSHGVALNLIAHEPLLQHLLELLDIEAMDLQEVPGLWRYQIT